MSRSRPAWVALDWSAERLRAWAMSDDNAVLAEAMSHDGTAHMGAEDAEPALLRLLSDGWTVPDRLPVLACGAIGGPGGWVAAPPARMPAAPGQAAAVRVPTRDARLTLRLRSGLCQADPPDIMRGGETRIAGFLSAEPEFDGVVCLPEPRSHWAQISAGEVVSFRTALTGTLFTAVEGATPLVPDAGWDDAAFGDAVADTLARPEALAIRLARVEAAVELDGLSAEAARARRAGLLIGAELAALRPFWLGQDVAIVGEAPLSDWYATALSHQGVRPRRMRDDVATVAGLVAAHSA